MSKFWKNIFRSDKQKNKFLLRKKRRKIIKVPKDFHFETQRSSKPLLGLFFFKRLKNNFLRKSEKIYKIGLFSQVKTRKLLHLVALNGLLLTKID